MVSLSEQGPKGSGWSSGIAMAWHALICTGGLLLAAPALAIADAPVRFDIEAQPLPAALKSFAAQANVQLLYEYSAVRKATGNPLVGEFDRREGLQVLLHGTGLEAVYSSETAATIRQARAPASPESSSSVGRSAEDPVPAPTRANARRLLAQVTDPATRATRQAEAAPETGAGAESSVLEEVVVTARFREERLQDVGAAITAFQGEQLERNEMRDVADLVYRTPGVDLYTRGPNKADVTIRGMANLVLQSDFQRINGLTGVFFDGLSVTTPANGQRAWNMFDLERVEILRGPQGTLYGEGSMGGAIRYVSRSPDLNEIEARMSGTFTSVADADDFGWQFNGTVGLPIVEDRLGVRLTGFYREDPGFIDFRTAGVEDANSFRSTGGRAVVLSRPTDRLTARVTAVYENSTVASASLATVDVEDLNNDFHPILEPQQDEAFFISAQLDYETDLGTLTSITGYFERHVDDLGLDARNVTGFGGLPLEKVFLHDHEAISQEVRFVMNRKGRFGLLLGAYYKDSEQLADLQIRVDVPGLSGTVLDEDESYDGKQFSLFGELSYQLSERLDVTAGLRYFKEDVDSDQLWRQPDVILNFIPTDQFDTTISIEELLPKFLLEFKATDDSLLYLGATQGARNGALNVTSTIQFIAFTGVDNTPFRTYRPDSAWSYEAGAKTSWLDGTLRANMAAYLSEWEDLQLLVTTPPLPPFFVNGLGFISNAGTARSIGAELELDYRPSENLRFFLSGTVADAELTEEVLFNQSLGITIPKGSPIPGVSDWTYNVGTELSRPLGATGMTLVGRVNYQRRAASSNVVTTDPPPAVVNHAPEFGLLNAGLGLQGESWRVDIFANNITNEIVPLYEAFDNIGFYINQPRVIGLTIEKSF